jgi:hypothetical protein
MVVNSELKVNIVVWPEAKVTIVVRPEAEIFEPGWHRVIACPLKDLGPLDTAPPRGVADLPYKNHQCEKSLAHDMKNE